MAPNGAAPMEGMLEVAGRVPAPVAGEEAEVREPDVSIGEERRSSR